MDNLWEKTLDLLKTKVTDQTFSTWFLPIKEVSVTDKIISLSVPNKFFESWIKEHYSDLIKSSVKEVSDLDLSLDFMISASENVGNNDLSAGDINTASPQNIINGIDPNNNDIMGTGSEEKKSDTFSWLKGVFTGSKNVPDSQYQKIGLNRKYTFENFVVGKNNNFAHAAALAITESPAKNYNPFFIYGGVGLGKTHLLQATAHEILSRFPKMKILYISSEEFTNQLISAIRTRSTMDFRNKYRNIDVLLIDDIQFVAGKESTQEEFFHTFNKLYDSHKQIIITSDSPPNDIPKLEERLVSRFAWGLIANISPPDFETRIAIFEKKCENVSIPIPRDVLFYLAETVKTNIREMEGALIRVVAYSNLTGNPLSIDLAKEVLQGMIKEEETRITMDLIQEAVSDYFGISIEEIKSKKRSHSIAFPRQIAMYLCRTLTDHSFPDIGDFFGGRDHTTVLHAFEKIKSNINTNSNTKSCVNTLTTKLKK